MKSIEIMAPVHGWAIGFADQDDVEGHAFSSPTKKSSNWGAGAKDNDEDVEGHVMSSPTKRGTSVIAAAKDDDEDVEGHAFISSGGTSRTGTTKG